MNEILQAVIGLSYGIFPLLFFISILRQITKRNSEQNKTLTQ